MDSEDKRTVWLVGLLVAGGLLLMLIGMYWHTSQTQRFIDGGFTRTILPGSSSIRWILPSEATKANGRKKNENPQSNNLDPD